MSSKDADIGAGTAIILEVTLLVEHDVDISRYVIASIYSIVDVYVSIAQFGRSIRLAAYHHISAFEDIAHQSATEDVMAVYNLDSHISGIYRTVETTAEYSTAESTARTLDVGGSAYSAGIATAHNVHYGVVTDEMLVLLAFLNVEILYASTLFHRYIDMSITFHVCFFAKATTEYAEVWRAHLIIYLLPFVGFKEVAILS